MKIELETKNCLYPMPTTLVGALVNEKPNYTAIAHVGIMELNTISLGMDKAHYTNKGIIANKTFSVNIPSTKLVKETDYCGIVSGKDKNKADMFKTFFGKLKTAPMIEECGINMECELARIVDFPNYDVFVGHIKATYCEEDILTEGIVDLEKVQPILFIMNDRSYWNIGKKLAKAWSIGKEMEK
jgi:flavin reductase (DIM6/NTAB) family NADH-FMN oxidoreductase RutF